jgi:hypothetical protein
MQLLSDVPSVDECLATACATLVSYGAMNSALMGVLLRRVQLEYSLQVRFLLSAAALLLRSCSSMQSLTSSLGKQLPPVDEIALRNLPPEPSYPTFAAHGSVDPRGNSSKARRVGSGPGSASNATDEPAAAAAAAVDPYAGVLHARAPLAGSVQTRLAVTLRRATASDAVPLGPGLPLPPPGPGGPVSTLPAEQRLQVRDERSTRLPVRLERVWAVVRLCV